MGHHSCSSTSIREGRGGRLGGGKKKKKKRPLHDSLLDPEIIAHAKSYQECGLSGGQTVVYSLFEVPPPQGLTRGEERERTSGSTAGGWGGLLWNDLAQGPSKQRARAHTHTAGIRLRNLVYKSDPTPNSMCVCCLKYDGKLLYIEFFL